MAASVSEVLILGCGYTGTRVARRVLSAGLPLTATGRDLARLEDLRAAGARLYRLDVWEPRTLESLAEVVRPGVAVLLSIPSVRGPKGLVDRTAQVLAALGDRPSRVVYLSTTGVYGRAERVDETTPVAPLTERQQLRVAAEQAVAAGPWPSLILRAAAIYGPGRGVHVAMREGRYRLVGGGANFISRIHVDDLAAHAEAALRADLTGAYPVADEEPCRSRQIAAFCAELLDLEMPSAANKGEVSETLRGNRRVDGRAIRRELGIRLKYPSYRLGIPAALAADRDDPTRA